MNTSLRQGSACRWMLAAWPRLRHGQPTIEAFDGLPSTHGGSNSLFLVTLTGPGKIYLATLPLSRIAEAMKPDRQAPVRVPGPGPSSLSSLVKEL